MATDLEIDSILEKESKDITVIGLDQALQTSGYAVMKGNHILESGIIEAPNVLKKQSDAVRRTYVRWRLNKLVKKYKPDLVVIEDVHFNGAGLVMSYGKLMGLKATLEDYLLDSKIPYETVLPSSWRKQVGVSNARGVDKKKFAIEKLKQETETEIEYKEDEAEAIFIAVFGTMFLRKVKLHGLEEIKEELAPKKRKRRTNKK